MAERKLAGFARLGQVAAQEIGCIAHKGGSLRRQHLHICDFGIDRRADAIRSVNSLIGHVQVNDRDKTADARQDRLQIFQCRAGFLNSVRVVFNSGQQSVIQRILNAFKEIFSAVRLSVSFFSASSVASTMRRARCNSFSELARWFRLRQLDVHVLLIDPSLRGSAAHCSTRWRQSLPRFNTKKSRSTGSYSRENSTNHNSSLSSKRRPKITAA